MDKFMQTIGWFVLVFVVTIFGANVVYYAYKGVQATETPGLIVPNAWIQPKANTASAIPADKRMACTRLGGEIRVGDASAYWCVKDGNRIRPDGSIVGRVQ